MASAPSEDDAFILALTDDDPAELYENAPCGYLSTLPDGTIVKVNRTFLTWTGYTRDDIVGRRRFQELLRVGDRIFYETHFAPLLRLQGRVREIAVELVASGGTVLPVLVNSVVKTNQAGEALVVRTAVFDARERRAYEAELVAARTRAEESELRSRALASTLQSSLLPPEMPRIPGLDVGGCYRPAGDGTEVGGDFYDIFDTGRGTWGAVIGDVCGKGAAAAAATALARYTIRAAAAATPSPVTALRAAHEALVRHDPERFCTAVLMTVAVDGGALLTVASAGHPLPLLRRADGAVETVGEAGSILGMLVEHDTSEVEVALRPGDAVILYTDGIVEARRNKEFFGEGRLSDVLAQLGGAEAQTIADRVVAAALDFQSGIARDDIAVVVVAAPAS